MIVNILTFHLLFTCLHTKSIRSVPRAVLLSPSDSILLTNRSRDQCLCRTSANTSAVNYFTNGTCQIFMTRPCSFKVQTNFQSRIYLLDPSFDPFQSDCSMNGTELIRTLNNNLSISTTIITPRSMLIDNHGYLVVLIGLLSVLDRYDPSTLTRIDRINVTGSNTMSLSHFNGHYFIGTFANTIMVIDSTSQSVVNIISSSYLQGPRDIIFLNNGSKMIIASYSDDYLVFFDRSTSDSTIYSFTYRIPFSHSSPFGLWPVNDTYFYVTSYTNRTVVAYSAVNTSTWNENLVVDARPMIGILYGDGFRITIDACGRFWLSMDYYTVLIYDRYGSFLGRFSPPSRAIYDLVITKDFTIFLSTSLFGQIIRLQPDLTC